MVQDEYTLMFISRHTFICKFCAFQNSWKKEMITSHPTHLQERLTMTMRYTKAEESADLRGAKQEGMLLYPSMSWETYDLLHFQLSSLHICGMSCMFGLACLYRERPEEDIVCIALSLSASFP